jgi:hypothetical protein
VVAAIRLFGRMNAEGKCEICGSPLREAADGSKVCTCLVSGIVHRMRLDMVQRFAMLAKWILVAAAPPVLIVSLSHPPDSLSKLNLLGLLLLVQGYFNGRIVSVGRISVPGIRDALPSLIDRRFDRDVLVIMVSAVIASVGYAYFLQLLLRVR